MDYKGMEGDGMRRNRSFRDENYNNRRAFLRSYPLHWGEEDENDKEDTVRIADKSNQKKPKKKIILSVYYWGGEKVLLLRRLKHKLTIYVIACIPDTLRNLPP